MDLVDRQQIVQEAWWLYNDQVGDYYGQVVDLDVVLDAPTVDAVEVVHGHWIYGESWMLGRNRRCSVCESIFPCNDAWVMFYCPDCGAKMDKEATE